MKTEGEYNPLSISNRVREKLEARHSGCEVRTVMPLKPGATRNPVAGSGSMQDMKDHFLDLVLTAAQGKEPSREQLSANAQKKSDLIDFDGTNKNSKLLNKQEQSKDQNEIQQGEFSFDLSNAAVGPLKVVGNFDRGVLQVGLQFTSTMDIKQLRVLSQILKVKLTNELGVPVEVKID